jgi:hypothetical protein
MALHAAASFERILGPHEYRNFTRVTCLLRTRTLTTSLHEVEHRAKRS